MKFINNKTILKFTLIILQFLAVINSYAQSEKYISFENKIYHIR